jgi:hypothetical protein
VGPVVDRFRLEQGEPEVRRALQQPLELGLVAHGARQRGAAVGSRERHAGERECEIIAELSLHDQPIGPVSHFCDDGTVRQALARIAGRSPG